MSSKKFINTCKKVRYRDHRQAVNALHRCISAGRLGDSRRNEQRVYECENCKGWHITSKPSRVGVTIVNPGLKTLVISLLDRTDEYSNTDNEVPTPNTLPRPKFKMA